MKTNKKVPTEQKRAGQANKRGNWRGNEDDPRRCKARTKRDATKRCSNYAIPGRDHCYRHSSVGVEAKHGLRSPYRVGLFEDLIAKFDDIPLDRVKDLTMEITLLRGVLAGMVEVLERADGDDERTAQLYNTATTIKEMVDTIGKTAERMERIEHGLKINLNARQVSALAHQVVAIINQEVPDPAVRQKISERIANLVVIG